VFIDETGAKTTMARLRGRALSGQRLHATVPWGHWKTTTFVASLRVDGVTAPMVLDGAMTGAAFKAHVEPILVPSLRPPATSSSWTIAPDTRSRACVKPSRRRALCHPTPPTSIPSNRPSPSSKPSCAKPLPQPSTTSGRPSPTASNSSTLKNAPTSSRIPTMLPIYAPYQS